MTTASTPCRPPEPLEPRRLFCSSPVALDTFDAPPLFAPAGATAQPEPELDDLVTTGRSRYFNLVPGYRLVLEGEDDGEQVRLVILVTKRTRVIDGVRTRVVREKETADGQLVEISRNFIAIDEETKNVFYFGEEVDNYEDGKIVNHDGAWRSGRNGATFGLLMPADPRPGMTFLQERAPGVALDEAEIISRRKTIATPVGTFNNALKVRETTSLEPGVEEFKYHAPNIGLIQDGPLKLVSHSELP